MAGSRLDRIGTIFSRMTGLLKTGAVKYEDRPIWYDIYRVFPPKLEPQVDRQQDNTTDPPVIMYTEDKLRAEFFKTVGLNPGGEMRNLADPGYQEKSYQFLQKCKEIGKSNPSWSEEKIFEMVITDWRGVPNTDSTGGTGSVSETMFKEETMFKKETMFKEESKSEERPRAKKSMVTADSLLKLFKEAAEEEKNKPNQD